MHFSIFGRCLQGSQHTRVDDHDENPYGTAREPQGPSVLNSCAIKIIGSPHVQAIAGAVVVYGLATWWLAGSGLLIAGIGVTVWLVSTVVKAAGETTAAAELVVDDEESDLGPANVMFTSLSASVGWATPAGWIVLGVWDAYCLADHLRNRCCPNVERSAPIITEKADVNGYVRRIDQDGRPIKVFFHPLLHDYESEVGY